MDDVRATKQVAVDRNGDLWTDDSTPGLFVEAYGGYDPDCAWLDELIRKYGPVTVYTIPATPPLVRK